MRADKDTTKTWVVFDALEKKDGTLVNELIYPGPKLPEDLFDALMIFRKNAVAVVCVISERYLQIKVNSTDC